MFNYPQLSRLEGLQLERRSDKDKTAIQTSDLYYDMGFLNGAMHWANEAYMMSGDNPRILRRLTDVYLIAHQYKVAEKFINLLDKSLVTRKMAETYKQFLYCDSCVSSNADYRRFYRLNLKNNFYASSKTPEFNLINLCPDNKMAFEYLIAYYLLVTDIHTADSLFVELNRFGYDRLPSACEEAHLLYLVQNGFPVRVEEFHKNTIQDFYKLDNILFSDHNGDRAAAKDALQPFKRTYWYYYLYNSPNW